MNPLLNRILLVGTALFSATVTQAVDFYATVEGTYNYTEIAEEKFGPIGIEGRAGVYVIPNLGIEGHASYNPLKSEEGDLTLSMPYNYGLATRAILINDRGSTLYVLGGYAWNVLDLDRNDSGEPGESTFAGFSYGIGLDITLGGTNSNWLWSAKYVRYYNADDLLLDTYSTGFRFAF